MWGLSSAGRASALQAEGHRFEPYRPHLVVADMAQLAEQLICNQQVIGSIPIVGFSNLLLQFNNGFDIISKHGWIPERPKGADCKSVVDDFGGSNPPPSIYHRLISWSVYRDSL